MTAITYVDFDLLIERAGEGYRARVLNSPAGQASIDFTLPFADMELENFLLRLGQTRHALVRNLHQAESEATLAPKLFGQRLFAAVFDNEVQACLRSSQDTVRRQGSRLRLRLHLTDAPELAALPWEYLYHASLKRFLALSTETPLVRYLDFPDLILPITVTTPLRLLVMISSPIDYPQLDVEQEWVRLKNALADLERRGLLVIERVEDARLAVLQQRLRQQEYHILHFIGHGGFDAQTQEGILLLEGQAERGQPVSGQDLGTLLHDHRSLRLVVLNACQGGRSAVKDPFAGVAQSLVQQRIPAVVAMQFEITDQAAIVFAQEFYGALADSYPVDTALTEARKAIFAQGNKIEWGTPVLYMRAPDGQLFDVKARNPIQTTLTAVPPKPASAPRPLVTQPPAPLAVQPVSAPQPADKPRARLRKWWAWGGLLALGLAILIGARLLSPTVAAPPATLASTPPTTATLPVAPPLASGPPKRIQFTPGTTSATLKGTLAGAEQRQYNLRALAGQTLTIEATANDASLMLAVQGVSDGVVYKELHQKFADDLGRWQGVLPKAQDYLLTLALGSNTSAPTAYTLHVSIPPLTAQPTHKPDVTPTQRATQLFNACLPTDTLSSFVEPAGRYCLRYPNDFRVGDQTSDRVAIYGPPLDQSSEPVAANLFIVVEDQTNGASLAEVVDQQVKDIPTNAITRQPLTFGGEAAEVVEGLPGQTGSRQVFILHGGLIYHLSFSPFDPDFPQAAPDVAKLWTAVTNSFHFMQP